MYWPLGAPRIYAASRRKRKPYEANKEDDLERESENKDITILGLQVARNGHLFTTINDNTLTVWQTSVRNAPRTDTEF